MIRKIDSDQVAEFDPPTIISVAFDQEFFTFHNVTKLKKGLDRTLYLEFQDTTFAELTPNYLFFQVGTEIDRG